MIRHIILLILFISILSGCGNNNEKRTVDGLAEKTQPNERRDRIRLKQYVASGKKLYNIHCIQCHQEDGNGLGTLYPPVRSSDYLVNNIAKSVCIIYNGQQGEIEVNGQIYNQVMPANNSLSPLQIGEITTYLLSEMNGMDTIITQNDVQEMLTACD